MAKNLFLICLVLLLVQPPSQSAPLTASWNYQGFINSSVAFSTAHTTQPVPEWTIAPNKGINTIIPIAIKSASNALPTTIYARLAYENEETIGFGLYGDVIVRFYEDGGASIPYYVSGLTVNYRVIQFDGVNITDYNSAATVSGENAVIASGQEHDYNDGTTQRWKDYHLLPGSGYVAHKQYEKISRIINSPQLLHQSLLASSVNPIVVPTSGVLRT